MLPKRFRIETAVRYAKTPNTGRMPSARNVGRVAGEGEEEVLESEAAELRALGDDLRDGAERDEPPPLDHEQARAQLLDEVEEVGAEDHRGAIPCPSGDGGLHLPNAAGIEAGQRLVEN